MRSQESKIWGPGPSLAIIALIIIITSNDTPAPRPVVTLTAGLMEEWVKIIHLHSSVNRKRRAPWTFKGLINQKQYRNL